MRYAVTQGERTVRKLAERLFGAGPRSAITKRAAEALLEANPGLAELATLPEGTPIAVPEIEDAEPQEPLSQLSEVAAGSVLAGAEALIKPLTQLLADVADVRVGAASERLERLRSEPVTSAASDNEVVREQVEAATAAAESSAAEAKALRSSQRKALKLLADDLERLRGTFERPTVA